MLRPIIHRMPPEMAHRLGLLAVKYLPTPPLVQYPSLQVRAFGLQFPNPIGLAAGFDKNAYAIHGLLAQGFGFVEAGTVTPLAQPGNPSPRLFRLVEDEAVINRLGFNNEGLAPFVARFKQRDKGKGIAGANIGKNKDSTDASADYRRGLQMVYPYADYITINISSPNTQGLRALQQHEALNELLNAIDSERQVCAQRLARRVPLLLKVAPDLSDKEKEDIAALSLQYGIDGLIVSNTTISRPESLKSTQRDEQGGLSGKPLFSLSTVALSDFYRLTEGKIPLIGVGGIASAADAYAKIRAGATLVQFYTALVYQGFRLIRTMQKELAEYLQSDGFAHVSQAVGVDTR